MPGTPRYRGLRRTANREALLGAAEDLFGTRGFGAVSVDEIVARAGVAKGTFYNHFADKEDLAAHLALVIRQAVRDRIAAVKTVSTDPATILAIAVTLFLDLALERPRRAQILVSLLAGATDTGAAMNRPLRATLEAGQASGRFRIAGIEPALVSVLGIVSGAIRHLIEQPATAPSDLIAGFVTHTLAAMRLNSPGTERAIAEQALALVLAARDAGGHR